MSDKTMMLVDHPMLETYYRKQARKLQALWENAKDEKQAQQIYLNLMPLQTLFKPNAVANLDSKERR